MSEAVQAYVDYMQEKTAFPATFFEEIGTLLETMGYILTDKDHWLLAFGVKQVETEIKNACNQPNVPEGLYPYAVRMVAAEFLITKKGMNQLQGLENMTFEPFVKQIQEGDTNITFGTGESPEQRFEKVLQYWLKNARQRFVTFRRLSW